VAPSGVCVRWFGLIRSLNSTSGERWREPAFGLGEAVVSEGYCLASITRAPVERREMTEEPLRYEMSMKPPGQGGRVSDQARSMSCWPTRICRHISVAAYAGVSSVRWPEAGRLKDLQKVAPCF
jgi:hypothetical protein